MIDRDSKRPEVFRLAGSQYVALQPDRDRSLLADTLQVRFRTLDVSPPRLLVEDAAGAAVRAEI